MKKIAVLFSREKYPQITASLYLIPVRVEFPGHHYRVNHETAEKFSALIADETIHLENLLSILYNEIPTIILTSSERVPFQAKHIKTCPPECEFAALNKTFKELNLPCFPLPLELTGAHKAQVFKVFLYMWQNSLTGSVTLQSGTDNISVPVFNGQVSLKSDDAMDPLTLLSSMIKVLSTEKINYSVKPLPEGNYRVLESWPSFLSRLCWSMEIDYVKKDLKDVVLEPADMTTLWVLPLKADEMAFITSLVPGVNYLDVAKAKGLDENTATRLVWITLNLNIFRSLAERTERKEEDKKAGLPEVVQEEVKETYSNEDFEALDLEEK